MVDHIDLKYKVSLSHLNESQKDYLLNLIDRFQDYKIIAEASEKEEEEDTKIDWVVSFKNEANKFKQNVVTIKQMKKGSNTEILHQKIREARLCLGKMKDLLQYADNDTTTWNFVKNTLAASRIDPSITKESSKILKEAQQIDTTSVYITASKRLIIHYGLYLNEFEAKSMN